MALGDKPTVEPQWAWDDTVPAEAADVKVPSASKQRAGWASGEQPAAQETNWALVLIYQWIMFFKTWLGDEVEINILGATGYNVSGGSTLSDGSLESASAGTSVIPIRLEVGKRIVNLDVIGQRGGVNDWNALLYRTNNATGTQVSIQGYAGTIASRETIAGTGINHTILTGETYHLEIIAGASSTARIYALNMDVDIP